MKYFFDTSALLKRYIEEDNSEKVDSIFKSASRVAISNLAYAEVYCALGFRLRQRQFTKAEHDLALSEFHTDLTAIQVIPFDQRIIDLAKPLAEKYGHKTLDTLQLATYMQAAFDRFVIADKKLALLAKSEKCKIIQL